jgi:hypothetical protein
MPGCPPIQPFGFPPSSYPSVPFASDNFNANHKDVTAQWYQAPATGRIDTVFWLSGADNYALDSIIFLRIDKSRIGPSSGPGVDFPSPCLNWGYWINSNDLDQGIAAFPQDSTAPWLSTSGRYTYPIIAITSGGPGVLLCNAPIRSTSRWPIGTAPLSADTFDPCA